MVPESTVTKGDREISHAFPPSSFLPHVLSLFAFQNVSLFLSLKNHSTGNPPCARHVLGAGTQREGRKGLVPVLEEPRSRGAADQQANSPKHVLEAMGTQGWVWALVTEENTLVF